MLGDRRQLAQEDVGRGFARRPARREVAQQRGRVGCERGIVLAARGDEVVQERDPVAVVVVQPIPQRPQPGPPREVGEQGRLAVAGVGEDQDDAAVDLGRQPIEQPIPRERLVAQRRALDLRGLDRVPVHSVASGSMCERVGGSSRSDGDQAPASCRWDRPRRWWGRERYGLAERGVNGGFGSGHMPHGGRRRSPAD